MNLDDACRKHQFSLLLELAYSGLHGWYQQRLEIKQQRDSELWQQHKAYIQQQLSKTEQKDSGNRAELSQKLEETERMLSEINDPAYLQQLQGTLGADWVHQ